MSLARYTIVVAVDSKNGIAKNGNIPWESQADLRFFKELTCKRIDSSHPQNVLIMGRKTYDSIPASRRPLVGRINLVLSRQVQPSTNGQVIYHNTIHDALKDPACVGAYLKQSSVFVIGGAEIYEAFLKEYPHLCDKIVLTRFQQDYDCDTFFPPFDDLGLREELTGNTRVFTRHNYYFPVEAREGGIKRGQHQENIYLDTLDDVYHCGKNIGSKKMLYAQTLSFDLSNRFPLLTTKLVNFDHVKREVLWMLRGNTDTKLLEEHNITHHMPTTSKEYLSLLSLPWEEGDAGPVSGWQLRRFGCRYLGADGTEKDGVILDYETSSGPPPLVDANGDREKGVEYTRLNKSLNPDHPKGIDQWDHLIKFIRDPSDPLRHTLSFWNPVDAGKAGVPPHELVMTFHVGEDETLSATLFQRSCDLFSMGPYIVASFALVLQLACFLTHLRPDHLHVMIGEAYIYQDHYEAVEKIIGRTPFPFPTLSFCMAESIIKIEDFLPENIEVEGYLNWPPIRVKAKRG